MNHWLFASGLALVVAATADVFWTTLWVQGTAGPITGHMNRGLNRALTPALAWRGHRALSAKGPLILIGQVLVWILLLWAGWTMAFSASAPAVVNATTHAAAGFWDRVYFVGYVMSAVGNGDYMPLGAAWQVCTVLASLDTVVLVSLLVTYLLAVIEAVVQKRSFASQVFALGHCSEDFVRAAWSGRGFDQLELQLVSLSEQVSNLAAQHRAYPMVHYYVSGSEQHAIAPAVAVLGDAILILSRGVKPELRPAPAILRVANASLLDFLRTLSSAHVDAASDAPPAPDMGRVRAAGVPTV